MRLEGVVYLLQHEVNELTALAVALALSNSLIVCLLIGMHHILNWQMLEDRMQSCQYQRLPQATCPAIAIREWMYELKLEVEDTRADEQMVL